MSTYPAAIDEFSVPGNTLAGPPTHHALVDEMQSALAAIENELGVNPSSDNATVADRLTYIAQRLPKVVGPGDGVTDTVPAAGNGTFLVRTLVFPAQVVSGVLLIMATLQAATAPNPAQWSTVIAVDSTTVGGMDFHTEADEIMSYTANAVYGIPAGTARTLKLSIYPREATGDITYFSQGTQIIAVFIPAT
jgi:hypothetical protein